MKAYVQSELSLCEIHSSPVKSVFSFVILVATLGYVDSCINV